MNWSVPAAIKWIRALEQFDLQFVEQPSPTSTSPASRRSGGPSPTPIAADEACTSSAPRSS